MRQSALLASRSPLRSRRWWSVRAEQSTPTYIFASTFPLIAGKTVRSVTLPSNTLGQQHVFAVGTG